MKFPYGTSPYPFGLTSVEVLVTLSGHLISPAPICPAGTNSMGCPLHTVRSGSSSARQYWFASHFLIFAYAKPVTVLRIKPLWHKHSEEDIVVPSQCSHCIKQFDFPFEKTQLSYLSFPFKFALCISEISML